MWRLKLGYRNVLAEIEDPQERKEKFDEMVAEAYAKGKAINVASHFEIDPPRDDELRPNAAIARFDPPQRAKTDRMSVRGMGVENVDLPLQRHAREFPRFSTPKFAFEVEFDDADAQLAKTNGQGSAARHGGGLCDAPLLQALGEQGDLALSAAPFAAVIDVKNLHVQGHVPRSQIADA